MNSQDLRNLQEAYLEVAMNEEKRKYPYSKVHNQNIRLQRNASSETDPEKQEAKYKQADIHHDIHTRVKNLPYYQLGNPENRLKPNGKTTSNSTSSQSKQTSSGETAAQRARRDPEFRRQMIRDRMKTMESYDLYDVILEYLLDEGYVETPEAAERIMGNMSEDWRESIAENVTSGKSRVRNIKPKPPTGPISNSEKQSRIDADNIRIKNAGDEEHAIATSKGLSFSDAQSRRTAAELRLRREIEKSYR